MEVKPAQVTLLLVAMLTALMTAGCGPAFNTRLTALNLPETCPTAIEDALAPVNTDPIRTSEAQLSCALQAVRHMQPTRAPESLEASKICAILAEACPDTEEGVKRRHALAWEGVKWAEHAMATGAYIDPASSYYYATNLGLAVNDNIAAAVKNLGKLHRHIERALSMDPDVDEGGPLRTLGYLLVRAPAWPIGIGDEERGLTLVEQAVTIYPNYPPNQFIMARAVWESTEDEELALFHIREGIDLLKTKNFGVRHESWKRALCKLIDDVVEDEALHDELINMVNEPLNPTT